MSAADEAYDRLHGLDGHSQVADAMTFPAVCRSCRTLHDAGKVEVVARYSDCSCWRCPVCGLLLDDRPPRWGGTPTGDEARRMARQGTCVIPPGRDRAAIADPTDTPRTTESEEQA